MICYIMHLIGSLFDLINCAKWMHMALFKARIDCEFIYIFHVLQISYGLILW
jgi:hypothetical protein